MNHDLELLFQWLLKYGIVLPDTDPQSLLTLKRLDLSGHKFEYIPDEIGLLEELSVLNLSNNRLEGLPETLQNLKSLINLDLRRNKLSSIAQISTLNLRSLNISFNRIRSLEPLKTMNELRVLDVSGNELVNINSVVASLSELRNLNASYNYLERFEVSPTIETLNLCQNSLYEISAKGSVALVRADFSDNGLDQIPDFLVESHLQHLDISSNKLKAPHLIGVPLLESIVLDNNPLGSLSFSSDFAPLLKEFSCASCKLEALLLPPSKVLETVNYASNAILSIGDTVAQYPLLHEIDISANKLTSLPAAMHQLSNLEILYAEENPLEPSAVNEIMSWNIEQCHVSIEDPIVIEQALESDLHPMAELLAQLFTIEHDFDINFDKQYNGLLLLFAQESSDLYVARSGNKVVGMITMQRVISTAEGGYAGLIEDLIVDAEYREMKIGTRLIRKMIHVASEKGYVRIQLAADKDNENGLIFYRQRGFKQTNLTIFHTFDF